jgi:hypothetical protein
MVLDFLTDFFWIHQLGFSPEAKVEGAKEKDRTKEKQGFVAGKHINKESKWWFQRSKKDWTA